MPKVKPTLFCHRPGTRHKGRYGGGGELCQPDWSGTVLTHKESEFEHWCPKTICRCYPCAQETLIVCIPPVISGLMDSLCNRIMKR